ncbi:hypothetical protein Ddye_008211 [Dipteronia dyeriana]|uniref:60S acidic ribosomal protein P2 n=1 Tax=Dipteronia dyeriana TaxID=168575 RepID=A0AAD9X951_9ROSI|nr:hypothetical protein Ddye_008211 [Dipteronia dyeriana]
MVSSSPTCRQLFSNSCRSRALPADKAKKKVVAAYLLVVLGGNTSPAATDIKGIFGSVGAECEDDRIELLLSQVSGKDKQSLLHLDRGNWLQYLLVVVLQLPWLLQVVVTQLLQLLPSQRKRSQMMIWDSVTSIRLLSFSVQNTFLLNLELLVRGYCNFVFSDFGS